MRTAPDVLIETVIGVAIEVHRTLGPGLVESVYELALAYELRRAGLESKRQVPVDVVYKGEPLGKGFRVDLLVEGTLPLELKVADKLTELHAAPLIAYLRLLQLKRGLLLNFNSMPLHRGIKRISI